MATKAPAHSEKRILAKRRLKEALKLAQTESMTFTLRLPMGFNKWLDEYKHLSYPERIDKQKLVLEGLILAYLRRGRAKEPILNDLLPEELTL